jgi:hypothetical protein
LKNIFKVEKEKTKNLKDKKTTEYGSNQKRTGEKRKNMKNGTRWAATRFLSHASVR